MIISKIFQSLLATELIVTNPLAEMAYTEVKSSIQQNCSLGSGHFIINNSAKNCNGVVPIKEGIYEILECKYSWYREKPLLYLRDEAKKGGPIDVYKEFKNAESIFKVGLEFETGNISSAHRSINKLCVGLQKGDLDMAMLMMPIKELAFYLTDRVSNYEELEPYFLLLTNYPFIVLGFDADEYNSNADLLPKGKDGMSNRAIHKWKDND